MAEKTPKSGAYGESDMQKSNQTERPILISGIGQRIGEAAAALGTRTSAYTVMGVSSAALQRYIKEENVPPFDAIARLCLAAGVRLDWMATGEGVMKVSKTAPDEGSQVPRLNVGTLRAAVEVLERVLTEVDATTDAAGRAELVVAIYELLEQGSALDAAQRVVAQMLRAASRATGATVNQG